jgi:hypothetical protein
MIWMIQYVSSLVFIKASICVTLLRIAGPKKLYRVYIYVLLGFVLVVFLVTFIGVLMLCRPFEANWNTQLVTEGKATCAGMQVMIFFSYFSTAGSIATDLACAVLPGVILWHTQMERRLKVGVAFLLSFGSLYVFSSYSSSYWHDLADASQCFHLHHDPNAVHSILSSTGKQPHLSVFLSSNPP